MNGLPGLPELTENKPVRVELLIRQLHWIFDMVNPELLKISSSPGNLGPGLQRHPET